MEIFPQLNILPSLLTLQHGWCISCGRDNGWKILHMHSLICQKLFRMITAQINLHQLNTQFKGIGRIAGHFTRNIFFLRIYDNLAEKKEIQSSSGVILFILYFSLSQFFFLSLWWNNDDQFILIHDCLLHFEICPCYLSISRCKYNFWSETFFNAILINTIMHLAYRHYYGTVYTVNSDMVSNRYI